MAGGKNIRCADYATFGSCKLSEHVLKALQGRKACLMSHHGLTCFEKDLSRALGLATEVEHLAEVYCRILSMGKADILSEEEMATVLDKFATYVVQD